MMKLAAQGLYRCCKNSVVLLFVVGLTGCTGAAKYTSAEHHAISLQPDDLYRHGIAFITPSSITGREQDRQSLALTFSGILKEMHPELRVVTLPETLGAINRAGLLREYKTMFDFYEETGIFEHEYLQKVSEVTGTRYLAQLKLAGFSQQNTGRFGIFGIRVLETKRATLRIFLQIWDSETGTIVWEGYEEMNFAKDTYSEQGVTFHDIAEAIARHMAAVIPYREPGETDEREQAASKTPAPEIELLVE